MSDESTEIISTGTEGGISSDHEPLQIRSALVAPTTSDEYNTIRVILIPIACWRVDDIRFEFGSSFIKPDMRDEMQELDSLMKAHPGAPLTIFGHADPVGQDEFNKKLSGRRSQAIYGMLIRDTDLWEDLYKRPFADDNWGFKSVQLMLENVGHSPGSIDGFQGSQSTAAIKAFQEEKGLAVDGNAGPSTRRELIKAYMDMICVDKEGKPYQLDPEKDFLAQGADEKGKGDYQGCSEFNPLLLFSQEEEAEYKQWANREKRNTENAPNRRIIIFLFRPGSKVTPEIWPCPRVSEGTAKCRKRFWSDGKRRRNERLPNKRREFEKTKDTFACRFYQLISNDSLCDRVLTTFNVRLYDQEGRFIAFAPFELTVGASQPISGRADARGVVRVLYVEAPSKCFIRWGLPPRANQRAVLAFSLDVLLHIDEKDREEEAAQKLHNLAYPGSRELKVNVADFQRDYGHLIQPSLVVNGILDDRTMKLIRDIHKRCADDLRNTPPSD
jgi:hypothetical protein